MVNGKRKGHPITGHEGPDGEYRFSSSLYLTLELNVGGRSKPGPGLLNPGKDPVPIVQEAEWAPGPIWQCVENLAPTELDPRTVQTVASRYTA